MSHILNYASFNTDTIQFTQTAKKKMPNIGHGPALASLNFVTPPMKTLYPRVTGNGNYYEGNPYCPVSEDKASFTIDLHTDKESCKFIQMMQAIDDTVLVYFYENQKRLLGRQNLTTAEIKMLQHRNVKQKDGDYIISLSCRKFYKDSVGNQRTRKPLICDKNGDVIPDGNVDPGAVVRCTMVATNIWQVNEKFGLHWELGDISIVAEAEDASKAVEVPAFKIDIPVF